MLVMAASGGSHLGILLSMPSSRLWGVGVVVCCKDSICTVLGFVG